MSDSGGDAVRRRNRAWNRVCIGYAVFLVVLASIEWIDSILRPDPNWSPGLLTGLAGLPSTFLIENAAQVLLPDFEGWGSQPLWATLLAALFQVLVVWVLGRLAIVAVRARRTRRAEA
jgi:hypothetical protein